ncbi:Hypothetical predicted protein [Olea europaea subsp. europaea]|uniref:Legume-specific protein n=1 Tax=Olea europaea subsp. europaea TaxID=158383 RepID=A0A8S0PSK6_OLEEU|nr:Hypothetical predicted protein [Olea europaea subsp. europaea]
MEGLIPFVYKAIVQYRNGGKGVMGTWLNDSSSTYYMRLPGDSGRLQPSDIQIFRSDCGFAAGSSPPPEGKRFSSQSTGRHLTSRRAVKG